MCNRSVLAAGALLAMFLFGAQGCRDAQSPSIALGKAVCETCGMTVTDARFAALVQSGSETHVYDSIECLLRARRELGKATADGIWIMDFETKELRPGAALTVVRADYPSPMHGGYAAFADSSKARAEAQARGGEMGTLAEALHGTFTGSAP